MGYKLQASGLTSAVKQRQGPLNELTLATASTPIIQQRHTYTSLRQQSSSPYRLHAGKSTASYPVSYGK